MSMFRLCAAYNIDMSDFFMNDSTTRFLFSQGQFKNTAVQYNNIEVELLHILKIVPWPQELNISWDKGVMQL